LAIESTDISRGYVLPDPPRRLPPSARHLFGRCVPLLGGTTGSRELALAVRFLLDERHMVEGDAIEGYERAFASFVGLPHAFSFSAARVGLYGILRALGVGPGHEVLLQVPTHIVVANAIRYAGAIPVYVDCDRSTFNMDLEQAARRVTPRTKALLLQHTFGIPADMDAVRALSELHGIEVIEDCVHALGATYRGRQVGSFGRAALFSTEETKTISTTMGGMVVTGDDHLAAKLRAFQLECVAPPRSLTRRYLLKLLAYHVLNAPTIHRYPRGVYELIGRRNPLPQATVSTELRGGRPAAYERRLSNAQAAIGLSQLGALRSNLAHRRDLSDLYAGRLRNLGFDTPRPPDGAIPAYVRFPVWVRNRPAVVTAARAHAILGTWFTSVLEEATSPAAAGYELGSCPQAELAARHLVNLPTHPRVTRRDAELTVDALAAAEPSEQRAGELRRTSV
jgi:perosamine synthetase